MPPTYQIRADYDDRTLVVYQAYSKEIAERAVAASRFVPPFSRNRMTWIKPSFLWLMERSNWGRKSGQEHILAVRITRAGWEEALSQAVLTHPEPGVHRSREEWEREFQSAVVHVQRDPERSLRGAALAHKSIQVGLSRHVVDRFADEWTVQITDLTPLVRKLYALVNGGGGQKAQALLPKERVYPVPPEIARRLGMKEDS